MVAFVLYILLKAANTTQYFLDDFIQCKIFRFLHIYVGLHDISKICNMG